MPKGAPQDLRNRDDPRGPPGKRPSGKRPPEGRRPPEGKRRPAGKGKPPARRPKDKKSKRRKEPEPQVLEDEFDVGESHELGEEPGDEDPDMPEENPWGKPEEEEEEEEEVFHIESDHAQHMELLSSEKLHGSPAVWWLLLTSLMFFGASIVCGASAAEEPGHAVWWLMGAGVALVLSIGGFAWVFGAHASVRKGCVASHIDIKRSVAPAQVTFGDPITATMDASACTFPSTLDVKIREVPSPGLRSDKRIILEGPGSLTYSLRAQRRGHQNIGDIELRMGDPVGLWRHVRRYRVKASVEVIPGTNSLQLRNMFSGRSAFPDGAPKALVNLFRDIEHEQIRDYRGGDRMKDVDWKRMGATGQMMVKDKITESLSVALLLIDAGTSMRLVHEGRRNLDFALEAASEIFTEGNRRNHQLGFLAFNDERLMTQLPPTRARAMVQMAEEKFQKISDPEFEGDGDEKEPLGVSLQRTLRSMGGSQMGVLLFSDLETLDEEIIQILTRLNGSGTKVGVLILPQPKHIAKRKAYVHNRIKPERGYRGRDHRRELREVLSVQGIDTLELPAS